jgi:hypothetical protein
MYVYIKDKKSHKEVTNHGRNQSFLLVDGRIRILTKNYGSGCRSRRPETHESPHPDPDADPDNIRNQFTL